MTLLTETVAVVVFVFVIGFAFYCAYQAARSDEGEL